MTSDSVMVMLIGMVLMGLVIAVICFIYGCHLDAEEYEIAPLGCEV